MKFIKLLISILIISTHISFFYISVVLAKDYRKLIESEESIKLICFVDSDTQGYFNDKQINNIFNLYKYYDKKDVKFKIIDIGQGNVYADKCKDIVPFDKISKEDARKLKIVYAPSVVLIASDGKEERLIGYNDFHVLDGKITKLLAARDTKTTSLSKNSSKPKDVSQYEENYRKRIADSLLNKKDYSSEQTATDTQLISAFKESILKAQSGSADAQFELGYNYYEGRGCRKDYKKAFYWYKEAANQNHAKAAYYLGIMFEKGKGIEPNEEVAVEFYRMALDKGNRNAILPLVHLEKKLITSKKSIFIIDTYFQKGKNLNISDKEVIFYKAALLGEKTSANEFTETKKPLSISDVYFAKALDLLKTNDSWESYWDYKQMKLHNRRNPKHKDRHAKAYREFYKAASAGHTEANVYLGAMNMQELITTHDKLKAITFFQTAADKGSVMGIILLAHIYEKGDIIKQDYKKASDLYRKATKAGIESKPKAMPYFKWLIFKAKGGDINALFRAGTILLNQGHFFKAYRFFDICVRQNHKHANKYMEFIEKRELIDGEYKSQFAKQWINKYYYQKS